MDCSYEKSLGTGKKGEIDVRAINKKVNASHLSTDAGRS
jgi:hypothetical protein